MLWNEPTTDTIIGEIRSVDDNSLIWTRTVSFPSISDNEYIYGIHLDIEATDWQYLDNIELRLVPVPSALILGIIGIGFAGLRFRKKISA
jgi:hypothetical protein